MICLSKFFSVLLALSMVISVFSGLGVVSYAADDILVSYSFNEYVTNSSPVISEIKADSYCIHKYADNDKGLKILLSSRISRLPVVAAMSGKTVISFDIAGNGQPNGELNLYSGTKAFKLLNFNRGAIEAYNGNPVGGISTSRPVKVSVVVDFDASFCDIYVNGKSVVTNYKIIGSMLTEADKAEFNFTSDYSDAYVLLDNINIHLGDKPKNKYPETVFLDEETQFVANADAKKMRVYANSDFEYIHDLFISPGSDYKTWHTEDDGNKCLELKQNMEGETCRIRGTIDSSEMQSLVMEMDIKLVNPTSGGLVLSVLRTPTQQWSLDVNLNSGSIVAGGKTLAKLSTKEWTNIAVVNKFLQQTYDVYINGEQVATGIPYSGTISTTIDQVSTLLTNNADCHVLIDNYKLYEADEPKEIASMEYEPLLYESTIPSDEPYAKMMNGKVGLHLRSGVLTANGKKNILDDKPFIENGRILVPVRAVSEAFGVNVDYDDATSVVTVGNAKFTLGSDELYVSDKKIKLDVPAKTVNSRAYLPLRVLCEEVLGKKVYYNDSAISGGMIIISDEKFNAPTNEDDIQELNDYLLFVRPDAQRILDEYKASKVYGEHPRIMINKSELANLKEDIKKDGYKKTWAEELISTANKSLNTPAPVYESYDGTRMAHTAAGLAVTFGMAYLLTDDTKYVDAAWTQLSEVCSWMDWNPSHYLDTGENAADVALAYDWLYHGLTNEQRKHIEEGLYRNAVMRTALANHGVMWGGKLYAYQNNWSLVCNGGVYLASAALLDVYPEISADNISQFTRGVEAAIKGFAPDGGWHEGPIYWNYGMQPFLKMVDTSIGIFGTEYGLMSSQGLDDTAAFRLAVQSHIGTYNYADADADTPDYPVSLIYLSEYYDEPGYAALSVKNGNGGLYGLLWFDDSISVDSEPSLPLDNFYEGIQVATMRSSWLDSDSSYAAWIGGLEYGSQVGAHGHLDSGSFIFDVMGERWALDMGRDSYLLDGYGGDLTRRFKIFRLRAESHNTIIINPDGSGVDHNNMGYAKMSGVVSKEKGAISTLDMTDTLAPHVNSAKRGLFLTDNRKSLVVRDELLLKKQSDIYWHMYTPATATDITDTGLTLVQNGKKLRVDFVSDADFEISFGHAEAMDGMPTVKDENTNIGTNKLQVKITGTGMVNFTAKLSPDGVYTTPVTDYDMPISNWVIADGSIPEAPQADMIYVDGKPLDGFDKFNKTYSMDIIEGSNLPTFMADAPYYNVEVITPNTYTEPVIIKLTDINDITSISSYTITFTEVPKPVNLDEYVTYSVTHVEASHEPQLANLAVNTIDGDTSTRWAAEGRTGVWIKLDLGKECEMDTLLIATAKGNARQFITNIEVSSDGKNWTKVFDGKTSGRTEDLEPLRFEKTKARYVKLNCFGTSDTTTNWQSVSELMPALRK